MSGKGIKVISYVSCEKNIIFHLLLLDQYALYNIHVIHLKVKHCL